MAITATALLNVPQSCLSSRRKEKVDEPPNKILKLKLLIRILILKCRRSWRWGWRVWRWKRERERERGVGKDRGVVVLINHCYENWCF